MRTFTARSKAGHALKVTVTNEGDPSCGHRRLTTCQTMSTGLIVNSCADCSYRTEAMTEPDAWPTPPVEYKWQAYGPNVPMTHEEYVAIMNEGTLPSGLSGGFDSLWGDDVSHEVIEGPIGGEGHSFSSRKIIWRKRPTENPTK